MGGQMIKRRTLADQALNPKAFRCYGDLPLEAQRHWDRLKRRLIRHSKRWMIGQGRKQRLRRKWASVEVE
jgi:hypothetical protein